MGQAPIQFTRVVVALLVGLLLGSAQLKADAPASTTRIVLQIEPEIDCPSCESGIKYLLLRRRGVRAVEVDVMTSRVTIDYVPALVLPATLIATVGIPGLDYHARIVK